MSYHSEIKKGRMNEAIILLEEKIDVEYEIDDNIITIFGMTEKESELWDDLLERDLLYKNDDEDLFGFDKHFLQEERTADWTMKVGGEMSIKRLTELMLLDKTTILQGREIFEKHWKELKYVPLDVLFKLDSLCDVFRIEGFDKLNTIQLVNMFNYLNDNFKYTFEKDKFKCIEIKVQRRRI